MSDLAGSDVAYLDHAATTPLRPEARDAMLPWLDSRFGNPSGAHSVARAARKAIDEARDVVAVCLGCAPNEVVFTSGGTESDNLAISGHQSKHPGTIVTTRIEHHAVLAPAKANDDVCRTVSVDRRGVLDLEDLAEVTDYMSNVSLVSVMAANNEIGTIQPLHEAVRIAHKYAPEAAVHSDAVQAAAWLDVAEQAADVDLISVSGHKVGGPQGVGVLVVRRGTPLRARQLGGGQEREMRSGTHNVAGIVGLAAALAAKAAVRDSENARVTALRDRLADELVAAIPGVVETARPDGVGDRSHLLPGALHLTIPGVESEALLFLLDEAGICASAASACASGAQEESHVLAAMGVPLTPTTGALRLSLGWTTTEAEVDRALEVLPPTVARLRESSGWNPS